MQSFPKIKVGFIGLGDHADEQLLPSILLNPNLELTAISSRNPVKLADFGYRYNVPKDSFFENWQDLILSSKVEAIIIAASPELHYLATKLALQNGKHIFIEKPPAQSLEQIQGLVELQKTTNCKTFVGYNFTFSAGFVKMQQILGTNIKFFRSKFISSRPKELNYHYQTVLEYGLFSMLVHPLATLIDTLGKIQNHTFQLTRIDQTNFQMTNFFQCESGNGVIQWGNYSNRFECDFELINEKSEIGRCEDLWNLEFSNIQNTKLTTNFKQKETLNYNFSPLSGGFDRAGYAGELAHFADSINQNIKTKSEIGESLEIYRILEEISQKVIF